jgi:hypothetical protein
MYSLPFIRQANGDGGPGVSAPGQGQPPHPPMYPVYNSNVGNGMVNGPQMHHHQLQQQQQQQPYFARAGEQHYPAASYRPPPPPQQQPFRGSFEGSQAYYHSGNQNYSNQSYGNQSYGNQGYGVSGNSHSTGAVGDGGLAPAYHHNQLQYQYHQQQQPYAMMAPQLANNYMTYNTNSMRQYADNSVNNQSIANNYNIAPVSNPQHHYQQPDSQVTGGQNQYYNNSQFKNSIGNYSHNKNRNSNNNNNNKNNSNDSSKPIHSPNNSVHSTTSAPKVSNPTPSPQIQTQVEAQAQPRVQISSPSVPSQTYYCEPCDKEFAHADAYKAHMDNHEKCSHPGCNFVGTKKVLIAHFHGSHGMFSGSGYKEIDVEGQKFRVLLGTSPDEVEQWRAERRKRFPTKDNTEKRKVAEDELVKAGGLLANKRGRPETKKKGQNRQNDSRYPNNDLKGGDINGEGDNSDKKSDSIPKDDAALHTCDVEPDENSPEVESSKPQSGGNINNTSLSNSNNKSNNRAKSKPKYKPEPRVVNEFGDQIIEDNGRLGTKKFGLFLPRPLEQGAQGGSLFKALVKDEILSDCNSVLQYFRFLCNNNFLQPVEGASIAKSE